MPNETLEGWSRTSAKGLHVVLSAKQGSNFVCGSFARSQCSGQNLPLAAVTTRGLFEHLFVIMLASFSAAPRIPTSTTCRSSVTSSRPDAPLHARASMTAARICSQARIPAVSNLLQVLIVDSVHGIHVVTSRALHSGCIRNLVGCSVPGGGESDEAEVPAARLGVGSREASDLPGPIRAQVPYRTRPQELTPKSGSLRKLKRMQELG